jgi:hypothetical protein
VFKKTIQSFAISLSNSDYMKYGQVIGGYQ